MTTRPGDDSMKIIRMSEAPKECIAGPVFTGPDVTLQTLAPDSREFSVNMVNFGKGVRNKFHAHEGEQVLIVTAGRGIVATETERQFIAPGDVVLIPAGEKHWHGAVEDAELSHIYVTRLGGAFTQLEE
jgi:quercetin dioxygenase-like cupin family protein